MNSVTMNPESKKLNRLNPESKKLNRLISIVTRNYQPLNYQVKGRRLALKNYPNSLLHGFILFAEFTYFIERVSTFREGFNIACLFTVYSLIE